MHFASRFLTEPRAFPLLLCLVIAATALAITVGPAHADSTISVGVQARVTTGTNVRSCPSTSCSIVGGLSTGDILTITGGPQTASGYKWWQHSRGGWSIDNNLTRYYPANPPPPPPPSTSCNPNADQVAFFVDANYTGACVIRGIGSFNSPGAMGFANDAMTAIRVGGNVKVTVCQHDNLGGTCQTFSGDVPSLVGSSVGNDQVSSAKVEARTTTPPLSTNCNPNADQVAFFVDANYTGACVIRGIGSFNSPGAMGFANDAMTAIRVGGNVKVTVCQHDNLGGTCQTFSGDVPSLVGSSVGNDQVSSAKVEARTATPPPSTGGWTFCANEGHRCPFSGLAQVRYGADGRYVVKTFTNGVDCNNNVFGDPAYGVVKQCFSQPTTTPPPTTSTVRLPFTGQARWGSTPSTHTGTSSQALDFTPTGGSGSWNGTVLAANDGVVIYSGVQENSNGAACPVKAGRKLGFGNLVVIYHPSTGQQTYYAHLASRYVAVGASVQRGLPLGLMGDTGCANGAHLHFELRQGGGQTPLAGQSIDIRGLPGMNTNGTATGS